MAAILDYDHMIQDDMIKISTYVTSHVKTRLMLAFFICHKSSFKLFYTNLYFGSKLSLGVTFFKIELILGLNYFSEHYEI